MKESLRPYGRYYDKTLAKQRSSVLCLALLGCDVLDRWGSHLDTDSGKPRLGSFEKSRKIHNRPLGAKPMILPGDVVFGLRRAYMLTLSKAIADPTVAYFRMES
jgi:hypothetical protein